MNDEEKSYLDELEDQCNFYSNNGKSLRERWVVKKFLKVLNQHFEEDQLINAPEEGLIDVVFKSSAGIANFEIKTIPNVYQYTLNNDDVISENDKVTATYKKLRAAIKKCREADCIFQKEIFKALNYQVLDEENELRAFDLKYTNGYELLLKEVEKYKNKYNDRANELQNVDLLFYCLRHHVEKISAIQINSADFKELGWRSISCVMAEQPIILYASIEAPQFLQQRPK